jgi:hypothetical protein
MLSLGIYFQFFKDFWNLFGIFTVNCSFDLFIIRLFLSDTAWPKVITLSVAYCSCYSRKRYCQIVFENVSQKKEKKTEMWKTRDEENLIDRHVRLSKPVSASNNKKATKFCNKNKLKIWQKSVKTSTRKWQQIVLAGKILQRFCWIASSNSVKCWSYILSQEKTLESLKKVFQTFSLCHFEFSVS